MKTKYSGFINSLLLIGCLGAVAISCKPGKNLSTPISGELRFICDETIASIIQIEKLSFEKNYPNAKLHMVLAPAGKAIVDLINNDVEFIVVSRELDSTEMTFLLKNEIKIYTNKVAIDGLAIVVNTQNPVQSLHLEQLKKIMTGEYQKWKDLNDTIDFPHSMDSIRVVFDGYRSGNYHLLRKLVLEKDGISNRAVLINGDSSTSSTVGVIQYIAEHPNSIGYISTSWYNSADSAYTEIRKIKKLQLAALDYQKPVEPIPGYIYRGDYPLRRMFFVMNRQTYSGLGAGFNAYLTGNEGQKIFLDEQLVPGVNPIRLTTGVVK